MRHQAAWTLTLSLVALLAGCSGDEKKKDDKPAEEKKPAPAATKPGPAPASGTTLCERLGGYDSVKKVVKDFVENYVAKDDRINAYFTGKDIPHLERMLSEQIGEAAGCPAVKYTGRDMKTVHHKMGVTDAEFDALVEDLKKCLDANGVKAADRDELVTKLAPMRKDIVDKQE